MILSFENIGGIINPSPLSIFNDKKGSSFGELKGFIIPLFVCLNFYLFLNFLALLYIVSAFYVRKWKIVEKSVKEFEKIRISHIKSKETIKKYDFKIPEFEIFSEIYEKKDYKKYIQKPCYIKEDSKIETDFIKNYLEQEANIEFWYKNWVIKEIYFWILYNFEWKQKIFYPDFIVKYKNQRIWIFDTKDWNTASSMETKFKAESLQEYLKNKNNLFWWIIIKNKGLFYINKNETYSFVNDNLAGFEKL